MAIMIRNAIMSDYEISKLQFITVQSENHLPNELEEEYKIGVTDVKNLEGFRISGLPRCSESSSGLLSKKPRAQTSRSALSEIVLRAEDFREIRSENLPERETVRLISQINDRDLFPRKNSDVQNLKSEWSCVTVVLIFNYMYINYCNNWFKSDRLGSKCYFLNGSILDRS